MNAANFFLAELAGVVMPFLTKFLAERGWRDDAIGVAIALGGLGVCLMQTPSGLLVDRLRQRRGLLAGASLVVGAAYGLLPLLPTRMGFVDPLLFVAGAANAFFNPLLGAVALGLVGHAALNKTMGVNQGWNHAGNIAAALLAMLLVSLLGLSSIFFAVTVVSVFAAGSVFLIRGKEIDEQARFRTHDREQGCRQERLARSLTRPAHSHPVRRDRAVSPGERSGDAADRAVREPLG